MIKKQIILVVGTSGGQHNVAHVLLAQTNFAVRVLAANAKSEEAIELQQAGAEILQEDLNNVESLVKVMKECYAVFSNTNSLQYFNSQEPGARNEIHGVNNTSMKYLPEAHYLSIQD